MTAASLSERLLAGAPMALHDRAALLQTALRLRRAAGADGTARLLAGRHVAIAGDAPRTAAGALFERAAAGLGARVSRIAPDLLCHDEPSGEIAAGRLLARLYDAVDCHRGGARRALELQRLSGVPVFLGLGGPRHAIRSLVAELADTAGVDAESALASLVQAVLVETLA